MLSSVSFFKWLMSYGSKLLLKEQLVREVLYTHVC